jgi:C2 domain
MSIDFMTFCKSGCLMTALSIGAALAASPNALAQASSRDVTVTITSVKAIDKLDVFSRADFYARVTINGQMQATQRVRQQNEIRPDWKITARVPSGRHNIKLEILDKDVTVDEPIDINKVANKRDLDFTIDTRSCRIGGFSSSYRCGNPITRAGTERKSAEVTFSVDSKRP